MTICLSTLQSQGALKAEGGVQQLWHATLALQQQAGALLASHANPGVRLQAAKFIEHLVIMFTDISLPCARPGSAAISQQPIACAGPLARPAIVSSSLAFEKAWISGWQAPQRVHLMNCACLSDMWPSEPMLLLMQSCPPLPHSSSSRVQQQCLQSSPWCNMASCMHMHGHDSCKCNVFGPLPSGLSLLPAACQGGRGPAFAVGGAAEGSAYGCPTQCCGHCGHQGSWCSGTAAASASGQDHAHTCGPGICSHGKLVLPITSAAAFLSCVMRCLRGGMIRTAAAW